MSIPSPYSPFFQPNDTSILCIGDIMLDRYIYGKVDRISPEAPVPILHLHSEFDMLGGVGNVVRNLSGFLSTPLLATAIGEDEPGKRIRHLLSSFPGSYLIKSPKTSLKTRYISGGQQLLRVDDELITPLLLEETVKILAFIKNHLSTIKVIILSDYGKGVLTPDLCQKVIQMANDYSIPTIVDPKGIEYKKYQGATLITPNLKELNQACRALFIGEKEMIEKARHLMHTYQFSSLLVTQGAEGMTLLKRDEHTHIKAAARDVFDVSGAGDTVIATIAVALSRGMDLEAAALLANTAAGIVVGKVGTATVTLPELQHALSLLPLQTHDQKIMALPELLTLVQSWRHQHLKVGFTNGCYDLLHKGHLESLNEAKRQCDRLIVAVNTDRSIKHLKGDDRPIQKEEVRSLILAALEGVDAVILFDEETPLSLIEAIIPDVLVKGADYKVSEVSGADIVLTHGGRVHLVPLQQGHSTTKLIRKIQEKEKGV